MIDNKKVTKKKKWAVAKKGHWRVIAVFDSYERAVSSISNSNLYEVREVL